MPKKLRRVSPSKPSSTLYFLEVTTEQFVLHLSRPHNVLQLDFIMSHIMESFPYLEYRSPTPFF